MIIFPRRNLNDDAEDWGREVEGEIRRLGVSVSQISQISENEGRGVSGQLAVLSRQIQELYDRLTLTLPVASFTSTASSSGSGEVTVSVSDFPRTAIVAFNCDFVVNSGRGSGFVTLMSRGEVVARSEMALAGNTPPGYPDGSVSMAFAESFPLGVSSLSVVLQLFEVTTPVSVTALNPQFSLQFGSRI